MLCRTSKTIIFQVPVPQSYYYARRKYISRIDRASKDITTFLCCCLILYISLNTKKVCFMEIDDQNIMYAYRNK